MRLDSLYRDIVETSLDGIWVIDAAGRTLYANRRIADLLGRDRAELDGLTVFDVLDDVGREQFAEHLLDLGRGETTPGEVECRWLRKDGTGVWVLVQESALYDEDGGVTGFLHRVSDYTERRRLFDELRRSQELLAEAQRIAKVGSYEWDLVADVIVASDELHALYGVPRETFGGTFEDFRQLIHADDRHVVDEVLESALAGEDDLDFVVRVPRGTDLLWVRGRGVVTRNEHGRPILVRGTHQDVTDAKESELALEDLVAQNTLMQAMATAANGAESLVDVLQDAQGLLLRHDDWERGRGFVPDDDAPDGLVALHVDRAERDADEERAEVVHRERDLAVRALAGRTQAWDEQTDPDRPAVAFPVTVGQDVAAVIVITAGTPFERQPMIRRMIEQVAVQLGRVAERERAARELAAARDAAMAASRQKSEFLATMSHEIRTPLNGVIGLNDLLLRTDLDAHQQRLATGAQAASRSLLAVINDILDFSKIEAGRLELEQVDFDVRQVFDDVAALLAESARAKGLELIVSCHPEVPERLNGDPTRLAQVLTNLGSNAVKFTDSGEVFVRATCPGSDQGPRGSTASVLRVEVVDTGVGVDPDKQERIFDPFSQADASTTRQYGGTGLGLAIAAEIVAALDGEIGLDSTPGKGATFWFTARFRPARGSRTDALGGPRPDELEGRRVLVVDDNAHNRMILAEHLGRWRAHPTTAPDAARALDELRRATAGGTPFDAVLLDMAMPGCDGIDLARRIRADPDLGGHPLLLLTSSTEPGAEELTAAGIAACLTKPVLAGDLRDVLLRVVTGQEPVRVGSGRAPGAGSSPEVVPVEGRPRVLVVEDNPVNRLVALGILDTLGYAAETVDDGAEAVERARAGGIDAVLMDLQMPRMDGYAATRAIREAEAPGRRVPILAMTAAAVEGERERCLEAGMDDFLTKPVDPAELGSMLLRWAAAGSAPKVLDFDRLTVLRNLDPDSTAYLDRAVSNFVEAAPGSVMTLRQTVRSGDTEGLTAAAHRLKGSALNLGVPEVGRLAQQLEQLGDTGDTAAGDVLVDDLEEALDAALPALLELRARWSSHR